jgi:hypothetical protein
MKKLVYVIAISTALLSGCASMSDDPMKRAAFSDRETIEVDSHFDNAKLARIGRELLEPRARSEASKVLDNADLDVPWNGHQYSTLTSIATDAALGKVGSSLGAGLGSAVFVASLFTGDGSISNDSGVYLPPVLDGVELDTAEKARSTFSQLIRNKIVTAAEEYGFRADCVFGCSAKSNNTAYHFVLQPGTMKHDHQPLDVGVSFYLGELTDAGKDGVLHSAAVGHPVKWVSKEKHTAFVVINRIDELDEYGNVYVMKVKAHNEDAFYIKGNTWLQRTPFGRDMMSSGVTVQ